MVAGVDALDLLPYPSLPLDRPCLVPPLQMVATFPNSGRGATLSTPHAVRRGILTPSPLSSDWMALSQGGCRRALG